MFIAVFEVFLVIVKGALRTFNPILMRLQVNCLSISLSSILWLE